MDQDLAALLREFDLAAPASEQAVVTFQRESGVELPADYVRFLAFANGGEGFLGEDYLMLWPVEDLVSLNRGYEVETYAPGLLLFGSNGGGEAFAFDRRRTGPPIVMVPFVPLELDKVEDAAPAFQEFLGSFSDDGEEDQMPEEYKGKEIFEIMPVYLGGDPVDPQNKVLLDREQHQEVCRYWNRLIRDTRCGKSGTAAE